MSAQTPKASLTFLNPVSSFTRWDTLQNLHARARKAGATQQVFGKWRLSSPFPRYTFRAQQRQTGDTREPLHKWGGACVLLRISSETDPWERAQPTVWRSLGQFTTYAMQAMELLINSLQKLQSPVHNVEGKPQWVWGPETRAKLLAHHHLPVWPWGRSVSLSPGSSSFKWGWSSDILGQ